MRRCAAFVLMLGSVLRAQGPVPRPAPPLAMLTGYRGQIVLLAFISTQCVHCQKVSLVLEQLGREFSGRAQVMEIAFDENADAAAFKRRFGLTFPVGTESSAAVHGFLGIPAGARLATPQMVAIDRAGIIRAQSEREGTPLLQTADTLRSLLIALLRRAER